ncbi:MAG: hypothetical protein OEZ19_07625, partial [Paracoccaceae bacterium]|nr:hypothetical protein [Paracoccaceae bacterium]
ATFITHTAEDLEDGMRLTALTVFDVGAFGGIGPVKDRFELASNRAATFAGQNGLGFRSLSSNIELLYRSIESYGPTGFVKTNSLRNLAAALVFESSMESYLLSSGMDYSGLGYGPAKDVADLDPVLVDLLSTERMKFVSACAGISRLEKIEMLKDNYLAQRMLDVCISGPEVRRRSSKQNCSYCLKCARTILTLDVMGRLENFSEVFDLEFYHANRKRIWRTVSEQAARSKNAEDAVKFARQRGFDIPRRPGPIYKAARRAKHSILKKFEHVG